MGLQFKADPQICKLCKVADPIHTGNASSALHSPVLTVQQGFLSCRRTRRFWPRCRVLTYPVGLQLDTESQLPTKLCMVADRRLPYRRTRRSWPRHSVILWEHNLTQNLRYLQKLLIRGCGMIFTSPAGGREDTYHTRLFCGITPRHRISTTYTALHDC